MAFRCFFYLTAFLVLGFSPRDLCAQAGLDFSKYEYHLTEGGAFGLYKPKGWKVNTPISPNGKTLVVTDKLNLYHVSMLFVEELDPTYDSVTFAGATLQNLGEQTPGLKILGARCSSDRMRTVVKYQQSGPGDVSIEGRYSFHIKHPTAVAFRYEAPASEFKEWIPTLLTVIANIILQDPQAYQRLASQQKDNETIFLPMRETSAPDNTCRLLVPEGWAFNAGKGQVLCASPDGDIGYLFVIINFIGESQIPYFDSRKIPGDFRHNYMLPIDAFIAASRHTGSRNHRVMERYSNASWATEASRYLKRNVDAETALISYTSKNGVELTGYYDVFGLQPDKLGQWAITAMGFWAPPSQFGRYLPSLLKIGDSHRINEAWAKEYVRHGQKRLQHMMRATSLMMSHPTEEMRQSSPSIPQHRIRSGDFASNKYSTFMRGEQEWVARLNGGAIVKTDHWGVSIGARYRIEGPPFNYCNFKGEKDGLIPVDVSREVYEKVGRVIDGNQE